MYVLTTLRIGVFLLCIVMAGTAVAANEDKILSEAGINKLASILGNIGKTLFGKGKTTVIGSCEWIEKHEGLVETLKKLDDAYDFIEKVGGALLEGPLKVLTDSWTDAVSYIITEAVVHVDLEVFQDFLHYQHPRPVGPDDQYLSAPQTTLVNVWLHSTFTYGDELQGCLKGKGIDVPRSGPIKQAYVLLDDSNLVRRTTALSGAGIRTTPGGENRGRWSFGPTDDDGHATFKLQTMAETLPNGQGDLKVETLDFTVYADTTKGGNVWAATAALFGAGSPTFGHLTVQWHQGSEPTK